MLKRTAIFLVWAELNDGTRIVHDVKLSRSSADFLVSRATREESASCGCCYELSPAAVLGIKHMYIEERLADPGDAERMVTKDRS